VNATKYARISLAIANNDLANVRRIHRNLSWLEKNATPAQLKVVDAAIDAVFHLVADPVRGSAKSSDIKSGSRIRRS
jgi:hypothetical protein